MNRITVLQIGKYYYPYAGGTETHLFDLTNELKKDFNIEVLVSNTRFKTKIENIKGVNVYRLCRLGVFLGMPLTLSLPFWLKKKKADILHFHLPNPFTVFAYFIARPKGKVVVSYHSDIIGRSFFLFLIMPLLMKFLKRADVIIVTSGSLIKNSAILSKFSKKCKIIPHGIDIDKFKADRATLIKSEEIKCKYGLPLILFVGRLVYYKGLKYLFFAMKNINARLLVVGDGPLRNGLVSLAKRLGIKEKIVWIGKIENGALKQYYHASDIFVLPSHNRAESFGIVQLEAFACGKPVVSTGLPTGVPFVNINCQTGLIVPPADAAALASAINKLLVFPDLRHAYGKNGEKRVLREFTKEKMADEVIKLYGVLAYDC